MPLIANHRTPPVPDSIDELLAEARARRQRTQAGQCDPHGDVASQSVFPSNPSFNTALASTPVGSQ